MLLSLFIPTLPVPTWSQRHPDVSLRGGHRVCVRVCGAPPFHEHQVGQECSRVLHLAFIRPGTLWTEWEFRGLNIIRGTEWSWFGSYLMVSVIIFWRLRLGLTFFGTSYLCALWITSQASFTHELLFNCMEYRLKYSQLCIYYVHSLTLKQPLLQLILLEDAWRELFVLGIAQWAIPVDSTTLLAVSGMYEAREGLWASQRPHHRRRKCVQYSQSMRLYCYPA